MQYSNGNCNGILIGKICSIIRYIISLEASGIGTDLIGHLRSFLIMLFDTPSPTYEGRPFRDISNCL